MKFWLIGLVMSGGVQLVLHARKAAVTQLAMLCRLILCKQQCRAAHTAPPARPFIYPAGWLKNPGDGHIGVEMEGQSTYNCCPRHAQPLR